VINPVRNSESRKKTDISNGVNLKIYTSTLLKMNFSTDLTDKRTDVHGLARRVIRENP